ncbi:MAG: polysaccharide biosynthesis tyrosine autokinase [Aquihabitans sp.]
MLATKDTNEVSLDEYVSVLRRRWMWIVLTPLLFGGLAFAKDVRAERVYSASTQLLLRTNQSAQFLDANPGVQSQPERALQNELRLITSRSVKNAVADAYGKPVTVRAAAGGEDDVIVLTASAGSGKLAAEQANAYAETYQDVRLETQLADLNDARDIVQQQVDDFQKQVDALNEPLSKLDTQILELSPDDPRYQTLVDTREQVRQRTEAERTEAQNQLSEYKQRLQLLDVNERLQTDGGIIVLNPATAPGSPTSPNTFQDVAQALIVGFFVGLALAFARDQLDDSLRSKADVERAVRGVPTLALVPYDPASNDVRTPRISTLIAPKSATAESYRGLRTTMQYAALERPMRTVQVTSASAGEAKTTTITNLAMAFALSGKRVALVDCDLRKPKLHRFLEVDGSKGFTSVVLGELPLQDALQTSPLHPNIDVLPSGFLPPNPSELLSHDRTARILQTLTEHYSIVFIDCPPVLPVTDSLVISRYVDATLFLVMADQTSRRTARRAVEMLRQVGAPLLGTVINGAADQETYGSLYEYYGYVKRSNVPIVGRFIRRKAVDIPSATEDILPQAEEAAAAPSDEPDPEQVST